MKVLFVAIALLFLSPVLAQQKDASDYLLATQEQAITAYREILASATDEERKYLKALGVKLTAAYPGGKGCRSALNAASLVDNVVVVCPYAIDTYAGALAAGLILAASSVDFKALEDQDPKAVFSALSTNLFADGFARKNARLMAYYVEMLHERHDGWMLYETTSSYCKPARVAFAVAHGMDARRCQELDEAKVKSWASSTPANEERALLGNMFHIYMRAMIGHELGHLRHPGTSAMTEFQKEVVADQYMLQLLGRSPDVFESTFLLWITHALWTMVQDPAFRKYRPLEVGGDIRVRSLSQGMFCTPSSLGNSQTIQELIRFMRTGLQGTFNCETK